MTITCWRIVKRKHAATAFTGEGSRRFGGRFNSKGVTVVYTSASLSLAALELLVHLQSTELLGAYVALRVEFDDRLVKWIDATTLPPDWRSNPPPQALKAIGDSWVARGESAVLQVPSAVIERESNFVLNPAHLDFRRIAIADPEPFIFDPRLGKR